MSRNGRQGDSEPVVVLPVEVGDANGLVRVTMMNEPDDQIDWWSMPFPRWVELAGVAYRLVRVVLGDSFDGGFMGIEVTTESVMHEELKEPGELDSVWLENSLRLLAAVEPITIICYFDPIRDCRVVEAYRIIESEGDRIRAKGSG